MNRRSGLIAFALVAVVGLAALMRAAATDQRPIAFSVDVPSAAPVASLNPGQALCEGPVKTAVAFAGILVYVVPAAAPGATLDMTVRDAAGGRPLATGRLPAGYFELTPATATLNASVPVGRRVIVCLRSRGPRPVSLLGAGYFPGSPALTVAGKASSSAISIVFLRAHPRSLLSLIPTIFQRAALFRPGWVGAWTFWVLAGGLLVAFALTARALTWAVREDDQSADV